LIRFRSIRLPAAALLLALSLVAAGPALAADTAKQLAQDAADIFSTAVQSANVRDNIDSFDQILIFMDRLQAEHPQSPEAQDVAAGRPLRGVEGLTRENVEALRARAQRSYNTGPCLQQPTSLCLTELALDFSGFTAATADQLGEISDEDRRRRDRILSDLVSALAQAGLSEKAAETMARGFGPDATRVSDAPRVLAEVAAAMHTAKRETPVLNQIGRQRELLDQEADAATAVNGLLWLAIAEARLGRPDDAETLFTAALDRARADNLAISLEAFAPAQYEIAKSLAYTLQFPRAENYAWRIQEPVHQAAALAVIADRGFVASMEDGRESTLRARSFRIIDYVMRDDGDETLAAQIRRMTDTEQAVTLARAIAMGFYRSGHQPSAFLILDAATEAALAAQDGSVAARLFHDVAWDRISLYRNNQRVRETVTTLMQGLPARADWQGVVTRRYLADTVSQIEHGTTSRDLLRDAVTMAADIYSEPPVRRSAAWTALATHYIEAGR
jgi:hypothetical protein